MPHPFSLGAIKDTDDERDLLYGDVVHSVNIPVSVDYEAHMTPVKDQGQRGACVAFATCGVKEYQESKEANTVLDLSEEFVYEQVRQPGGGAQPRDALKLLKNEGVCLEDQMPYRHVVSDAKEPTFKSTPQLLADAAPYKAKGYVRLKTIGEMMQSLTLNGPFVIGVDWLDGWFNTKRKVDGYPILHAGDGVSAGGHALCVVGYDLTLHVFKFKNSWGTGWGKGGYGYFDFSVIEDNLNDAWATIDLASPMVKQEALPERLRAA